MVGDCLGGGGGVVEGIVGFALLGVVGGAEVGVAFFCCAADELDFDRARIVVPAGGAALDDGEGEAFVALETGFDGDEEVVLFDEA